MVWISCAFCASAVIRLSLWADVSDAVVANFS